MCVCVVTLQRCLTRAFEQRRLKTGKSLDRMNVVELWVNAVTFRGEGLGSDSLSELVLLNFHLSFLAV